MIYTVANSLIMSDSSLSVTEMALPCAKTRIKILEVVSLSYVQ